MDFLRSGFRQQTGNLRVDTFPGPILDNDTDRIKRISNYLILLFQVNWQVRSWFYKFEGKKINCRMRQLVLLLQYFLEAVA